MLKQVASDWVLTDRLDDWRDCRSHFAGFFGSVVIGEFLMPLVGRTGTSMRGIATSLRSRLQGGRLIVPFALASHTSRVVGPDFGSLSDPNFQPAISDCESEG